MKKLSFLDKLRKEGALEITEPSDEIAKSYLIKSEKCTQVAKLAFNAGIYENAVSEAYYSIYNTVTALFYKCGIKCENHAGAVIMVKRLFKLDRLHAIFSEFKRDRIDNQYYTPVINAEPITKEKCEEMLKTAQRFNAELRAYMEGLTLEAINKIRGDFERL
ncbi:MAG TPA: HEPN domain-containing protein [Candidatus Nanoarchaeia archaeon]|nr:HEPN domain-containing protein [Candidatus Nanoarchaeia archaeon]